MNNMFFKNKTIKDFDQNQNLEELRGYAIKNNIPYYQDDIGSQWNSYAHKIGLTNGLTQVETLSFCYMITTFFGNNLGFSCSTEYYFKEHEIELHFVDKYNEIAIMDISEKEKMKRFFEYILKFYKENLEEYSYKTEIMTLKVSIGMKERFNQIDGRTKAEKFRNLMSRY